MKKVVFVIASDKFRDEEYFHPKDVLTKNNVEVITASSKTELSTGMLGAQVKPEVLLKDINENDYDGIIFVGGVGSKEYFNDNLAHTLAKSFYNQGKVVGAICIAPSILANAGLLKGKRANSYPSEVSNLMEKGAIIEQNDVVVDGKIITATGPAAATKFGMAILEALK